MKSAGRANYIDNNSERTELSHSKAIDFATNKFHF